MKILHTADWHFREKDHDEIAKCVTFILEEARAKKPDLICISGDITDSKNLKTDSRSLRTILYTMNRMLDIAPVAVVIGTASHDGKTPLALKECRGKYPILVSDMPGRFAYLPDNQKWVAFGDMIFPHDKPSLIVCQIPQPTKQYFVNYLSIEDTDNAISAVMGSMLASFAGRPRELENIPLIVNGHGQIGGAFISETQQLIGRDIEISKDQLKSIDPDLVCFGHIHKSQDMSDNIFYSGSPTRMNFGEKEEKGFYIHNLERRMISGIDEVRWFNSPEFIKTPARQMINIKHDETIGKEKLNLQEFLDDSEEMPAGLFDKNDHVKFEIKVWQDEAAQVNAAAITKAFEKAGAGHVKILIIRVPRETVRSKKVLEADTLPDKIAAMAELRGEKITGKILYKAACLEAGKGETDLFHDNAIGMHFPEK